MKIGTIHAYLPEEAVDCWYPVRAEHIGDDLDRILDEAPNDPMWEFGQGEVVRCRRQPLYGDSGRLADRLVAYAKVEI